MANKSEIILFSRPWSNRWRWWQSVECRAGPFDLGLVLDRVRMTPTMIVELVLETQILIPQLLILHAQPLHFVKSLAALAAKGGLSKLDKKTRDKNPESQRDNKRQKSFYESHLK